MAATIRIKIETDADDGIRRLTRDLDDLDAGTRRAGSGFSALGGAISVALGGAALMAVQAIGSAVVGFAAGTITAAADFEAQMSGIQAVLSPTRDEMEALRQTALDLGSSTAFSASEAAAGIEMLARNGLSATEILDGAAAAALALAAATGTDLSTAADVATDVMAIFGIAAADMGVAINGITGVTVASKFTIDDFRLALAQAGGVASAMGVEFDDFNTVIAGISPLFASGSDAGTSFKTLLQRLVPGSKAAERAMRDLGIITADGSNRFFDAAGNLRGMDEIAGILQESLSGLSEEQRNAALATIFGTDAMRAAVGLARLGADGFRELQTQIGQVDANQQAATRLQNFNGALEQVRGAVETLQITIGSLLLPVLTRFLNDTVTPAVGTVITLTQALTGNQEAFASLAPWVQTTISLLRDQWQPILMAIAGTIVALVVPTLASIVTAMAPVIAIIAAVIAIGIALYQAWNTNFLGIRDITQSIMDAIGTIIRTVMGIVLAFWRQNGRDILRTAQTVWNTIVTVIGSVVALIATILQTVFGGIAGFIQNNQTLILNTVTVIWRQIQNVITTLTAIINGIVRGALSIMRGDWEGARQAIGQIVDALRNFVVNTFTNLRDLILPIISAIRDWLVGRFEDARTAVTSAVERLRSMVSSTFEGLRTTITTVMDGIRSTVTDRFTQARDTAVSIVGMLRDRVGGIMDEARHRVQGAIDGARQAIVGALERARDTAVSIVGMLRDRVGGIMDEARHRVQGAIDGARQAIVGALERARDTAVSTVEGLRHRVIDIINGMRGTLSGINLADAARSIGQSIIDGIVNAIRGGVSSITSAARQAAQDALNAARRALGIRSPSQVFADLVGLPIAQGMAGGILAGVPLVQQAAATMAGGAVAAGRQAVYHQQRTINYTAHFHSTAHTDVSDVIARSLANL